MMTSHRSSFKLSVIALTLAMPLAFGIQLWGQEAVADSAGKVHVTGLPDDWTHHHLIFSGPGPEEEAIRNGTHERWLRTFNDPRYIIQQLKKGLPARQQAEPSALRAVATKAPAKDPQATKSKIKKDWNEALGTASAPSYAVYPAKWSFSTDGASCANDFVVYPTGQAGASSRASIIAYYNLYTSGCSGTVPRVDWAYNTGGTVALSPVFSFNGNQVAFIQTSGSVASLVLLSFPITPPGTGTLTSPIAPTSKTPATYPGCTAPCMTSITLNGNPNDPGSNPYYDYLTDSLYVGDSAGKLHKFNPVFNGTPAEVTTSWPVQLKSTDTNQVASPVYDVSSGYVFVGTTTSASTSTGGFFYAVGTGNQGTTSGSVHGTSGQLDNQFGIRDAPLVDSTAGKAYVFVGNDATSSSHNGVYQFATSFTSGTGTEATFGTGGTGASAYQFAGTFDNTYYSSSNGASPSGYLYVCGTAAPATLYQVAVNNNVMGSVVTGPAVSDSSYYGRCSPITEFYNTSLPQTATGSVVVTGTPATTWAGSTVTIGSTVYTFATSVTAANQVLLYTSGSSTTTKRTNTAKNLYAAVNAIASECTGGSGCFGAGTTANASVTASNGTAGEVDLTAKTSGAGGDFTLSTTQSGFTVSEQDGSSGTDYIFFSVFAGTQSGCTNNSSSGCVMSFDVTSPAASNFNTSLTANGTQNLSAPTTASPTGGIIVDNGVSSPAGTSQIYFETQSTSGTTPCTGICAVQASQTAP